MPSHNPTDRCSFRDVAGRRCRLPRKRTHPDLCGHHASLHPEGTPEDPQQLLAEVLGPQPDLGSVEGINRTVGNLLSLLIARRLPARHVAIAGYLCQLLIQTLPHFEREDQLAIARNQTEAAPFQFFTHIPPPEYPSSRSQAPVPQQVPDFGESREHQP